MDDNVVDLNPITVLGTDPERIIERARKAGLGSVTIVGLTENGSEFFASSYADGPNALWDLERAKHRLLSVVDELSDE